MEDFYEPREPEGFRLNDDAQARKRWLIILWGLALIGLAMMVLAATAGARGGV